MALSTISQDTMGAACHHLKKHLVQRSTLNRRITTGKLGLLFVMDGACILSLLMEDDALFCLSCSKKSTSVCLTQWTV